MAGLGVLVTCLLSDDPQAIVAALLDALRTGCPSAQLSGLVAYAAALRIAHFPTSNEFSDWDTALHSFTFANAVQQGLLRSESPELLRGVFDAAMSVYLNRFLNVPAVRLPSPEKSSQDPQGLLGQLVALLDQRHQVDEAAQVVAEYSMSGSETKKLLAVLGRLLLREDRDFHTIPMIEAAYRQHAFPSSSPAAQTHVLVAAARVPSRPCANHARRTRPGGLSIVCIAVKACSTTAPRLREQPRCPASPMRTGRGGANVRYYGAASGVVPVIRPQPAAV